MIAHLYICNRSFRWNGIDQLTEFQQKMVEFQKMMEHIKEYAEENHLYLFIESFLRTEVLDGVVMSDIICDFDKAKSMIGKDAYVILMGIMNHCNKTNATIWDLKEYLTIENEDLCHAVIAFSPLKGIESHFQLISTEQGWYDFRRHYLGKYPKNPTFFMSETKKYFQRLKLHPNNKSTIRDVLNTHPMLIVKYLSALNDHFADDFRESGKDLNEYLSVFALNYHLEGASLEGSKNDKFKFQFQEEECTINAYCEAHLKMYHDDKGNADKHCRIYFKKPILGEKHIYVGYIGKHL